MTLSLFAEAEPIAEPLPKVEGPFAGVALEQSIDRVLDYAIPPRLRASVQVGQRVRVPLGKKQPARARATSCRCRDVSDHPQAQGRAGDRRRAGAGRAADDGTGAVDEPVLRHAAGDGARQRHPVGGEEKDRAWATRRWSGWPRTASRSRTMLEKTKAPKRRAILARLLQLEAGTRRSSSPASPAKPAPRRRPSASSCGWASSRSARRSTCPRLTADMPAGAGDEADIRLNDDQQKVFDDLRPRVTAGGFSRQPAARRHRQRQDRSLSPVHPRGRRAGAGRRSCWCRRSR